MARHSTARSIAGTATGGALQAGASPAQYERGRRSDDRLTHRAIDVSRKAVPSCGGVEGMAYARMICIVALSACSGARVPPADVTAPPGLIEGKGFKIPNVRLQCTLTDTSGAGQCAHRSDAVLNVTVNKLKDCNISAVSHELTLHLENDSPNDP